jgi:hypothetical protein
LPRHCLLARTLRLLLLGLLGTLLRRLLRLLNPRLLLRFLLLGLLGPRLLLRSRLLGLLGPLLLLRSRLLLLGLLGPRLLLRRSRLLRLLGPLLLLRSRLLRLLGPLLWLRSRLLSLLSPLLLLRSLLLGLLGPLLWLRSRLLLLCGWPCCLLPCRLALFLLLFVLRIRRDDRRKEQDQGGCTCSSIESHCYHPPLKVAIGCARRRPVRLLMFRRLGCLGLGLGLVHRSVRVVGRRVKRVQLQRHCLRCIDHVVVRACRNHDRISVSHLALLLLVEDEFGVSLFDPEELVDVRVHLVADFLPRPQTHQHKLGVLSGE